MAYVLEGELVKFNHLETFYVEAAASGRYRTLHCGGYVYASRNAHMKFTAIVIPRPSSPSYILTSSPYFSIRTRHSPGFSWIGKSSRLEER